MEFTDFLNNSREYKKIGARIPRGLLLSGPPGTGKTLLAKATAAAAGVPFYSISGSAFMEMFVGVGPARCVTFFHLATVHPNVWHRVRDLFAQARKHAPAIIFVDELDAIGKSRTGGGGGGGMEERESTLNQLLVEMDGFDSQKIDKPVIVFAATNRPEMLDSALTRAGRFDRQVQVNLPDVAGRKHIFNVHLKNVKVDGEKTNFAAALAKQTPGLSGADIANVCNEGALIAVRNKRETATLKDLEAAITRIIAGVEKKTQLLTPEERNITAYHEAGHAVVGWTLPHSDAVIKVSIIPRTKGALGFTQFSPKDVRLYSQEQIFERMCMALGGRAAEKEFFDSITSGAQDDLTRVTQMAYAQTRLYGMNEKVGMVSFDASQAEAMGQKPFSEETSALMDSECRALIDRAYVRTLEVIRASRDKVAEVAELLLVRESINYEDMERILGPKAVPKDKVPLPKVHVVETLDQGKVEVAA